MKNRRLVILTTVMIMVLVACSPAQQPQTQASTASAGTEPPTQHPADSTPTITEEPYTPPEHPIAIRTIDGQAEFFNRGTGQTFIPRGTNYIKIVRTENGSLQNRLLGTADFEPDVIRANFALLHELGYNTVRIFIDSCSSGPTCIAKENGTGLNTEYIDNLVSLMQIAKDEGIFLLLTSNDLPSGGGYTAIADRDPSANPMVEAYRNGQMLTSSGQEATAAYWEDLMSALEERRAPFDAVLGWELFNEQWLFTDQPPLSLNEGIFTGPNGEDYDLSDDAQKRDLVADSLMLFINTMRSIILKYDPSGLVTMGFFTPDFPNPTRIGDNRYVDTAILIERDAPLDFYDIHAYPGDDITIEQIVENYGVQNYEEKPVILGEYGAFEDRFNTIQGAARATGEWAAGFCESGIDGTLYWTLTDLPAELGDPTWGLLENDAYLLNLFAPVNQPEPCVAPDIETDNRAFGATVTASRSLPDELPEYAVDENTSTMWGAGASPPQWIEIDLGQDATINSVRLMTSQYPAGDTVHEVRVRSADSTFETVHTFNGYTTGDQWLEFIPDTPLENVRYVRVYTLSSPSWVAWKEIEIR